MKHILIIGAGRVGTLIALMLSKEKDYVITLVDQNFQSSDAKRIVSNDEIEKITLDCVDKKALCNFLKNRNFQAMVSCLPYFCNQVVAKLAKQHGLHYFDLTEDVEVTQFVKKLAKNAATAFVPQCGLAPGFISICTNSLMKRFDSVDSVKMRVGNLPINSNHALQYSLTWSTEGLINEYGSLCHAIESGKKIQLAPLAGLETIQIDGLRYEAFNTSGGLGTLADAYYGKVEKMNYKSIRYPGHCIKMRFLMNDLKLNNKREMLRDILEGALPKTYQDVVIIYVSIVGLKEGELFEENYVKKVYPSKVAGFHWSALQTTTASGVCGVLDLFFQGNETGLVHQQNFSLDAFLANRFGVYYQS